MNYQFVRCRTSPLSKLGRLGAIFLYPTAGILFLLSSLVLFGSLFYTKDITFIQMSVILVLVSGTISLSFYLFKLSKMCYALESREIAFDQSGLTVRDRTDHLYKWNEIGGIGIIAYAASASRDFYESQICIFLETVDPGDIKRLFKSYLFGAANLKKYVLIDLDPSLLDALTRCSNCTILDYRMTQLRQ